MPSEVSIRPGGANDIDAAIDVWFAANVARRGGRPIAAEERSRVRRYLESPGTFMLLADDGHPDPIVGMAAGMQGLDDDGAGPPIPGLCHIGLVFVRPDRWGAGIGRLLTARVLHEARARGYERAQLWTHADNTRAQRLYEGFGFARSGREKDDDRGERIVHYELPTLTVAPEPTP